MPRNSLPAEENCRLLSVYMRPWTLDAELATESVPLLTDLRSSKEDEKDERKTYSEGWRDYITGNVVTNMQKTYIQNLLMAATVRMQAEVDETSSDDSDFDYNRQERSIGNLSVAQKTIAGLAANDEDLGTVGFGEYEESITLGRSLWQTDA